MKEKIEKVKSWTSEHKDEIIWGAIAGGMAFGVFLIGMGYGELSGAYKSTVGWMKCMCEHPEALAKDLPELLIADAKK